MLRLVLILCCAVPQLSALTLPPAVAVVGRRTALSVAAAAAAGLVSPSPGLLPLPLAPRPVLAASKAMRSAAVLNENLLLILRVQEAGATGAVVFDSSPGGAIPNVFGPAADGAEIPGLAITYEDGRALTETLAAGITPTVRLAIEPGAYGYTRIIDVSDPSVPTQVAEITITDMITTRKGSSTPRIWRKQA